MEEASGLATARTAAVAAVGSRLCDRVEEALSASKDAMRFVDELESADELRRRKEARDDERERRIRQLTDEVERLSGRLAQAERENAQIRADLDRYCASSRDDHKIAIDAKLEKRDFRNSVLDLLAQLAAAVRKRLGFVPHDTRKDINAFIAFLTQTQDDDDEEEEEDEPEEAPALLEDSS
mmetsp:Transcript_10073/g.32386  ORF Transcript_10073/g.32386 Transcript_10073/m.32386 type:complete len:181 (+) Transcript_10073:565-1107(+)